MTSDNKIVLGFIGRLSLQKNPEIIIKAVSTLSTIDKLKLLMIGDGPLRASLEEEVKHLKIENNVFFLGAIPERKKKEMLAKFDIFLMPSLEEGCPIGLLEAMAAGKAIVASNISSIQEVVKHGEGALLVNPYNVEELVNAATAYEEIQTELSDLESKVSSLEFQRVALAVAVAMLSALLLLTLIIGRRRKP